MSVLELCRPRVAAPPVVETEADADDEVEDKDLNGRRPSPLTLAIEEGVPLIDKDAGRTPESDPDADPLPATRLPRVEGCNRLLPCPLRVRSTPAGVVWLLLPPPPFIDPEALANAAAARFSDLRLK